MPTFNFTTGPASLPDVGELSYNGCVFGPLFESQVSCAFLQDEAKRTTKAIEYTITVDGYVTLEAGHPTVEGALYTLEKCLSAPAGPLVYNGRSIEIEVNTPGGDRDISWGPVPEILDIVPMGGGGSAKIKWTIKTRVPPRLPARGIRRKPILQFCYDTAVSYDEAGYSKFRMTGITEIPLTRSDPASREVRSTVDDFRSKFPGELLDTIDLTRFRVISREFNASKDKRSLTFNVECEELPWMAMPADVTIARGQFTFKPVKASAGLCNWLCTLSVTYTVPKGRPRRVAWWAFLALLRLRMQQGVIHGNIAAPNGNQNPGTGVVPPIVVALAFSGLDLLARWRAMFASQQLGPARQPNVILIDVSGTEGLYLDSRTVAFSASWRLVTTFSTILLASGLWTKVSEQDENAWATSVKNISGYSSWLQNRLKPEDDAIIDFGY